MSNGKDSKNSGCGFGKVTREKVENLEKSFEDFRKNDFHSLRGDFHALRGTVDTIRDELLGRLPSSVVALITILGSVATGLIVFAAMK